MTESEKIKEVRGLLNLSQSDFALALGMKQGLYSKIERGESKITNESVALMIEKYGINPNWWFFGENPVFMKERQIEIDQRLKEKEEENIKLKLELGDLYKQLAAESKQKYERLKNPSTDN